MSRCRERLIWDSLRRIPRIWVLALVLAPVSAAAAVGERGRVTGTVLDAGGQPVPGLVLNFSPVVPETGDPRTVETNDRSRFSDLRFPAGEWRIDPRAGAYFLESLTYTLLDKDGLKRQSWGAKAHPRDGFPPFQVPPGATVRLDLVAADPATGAELDKAAAWAGSADAIDRITDLFNAGKAQEAHDAAIILLEREPDLGPALYLRGAALNRLGRRDEAIRDLRRARELLPDQAGIGGVLGEALLAHALDLADGGDIERARPPATEAAGLLAGELGVESPYGRVWNHALALKLAGRKAELQTALVGLIGRFPDQPDPYQELAELQFQAGEVSPALATLDAMPAAGATNGAILLFNHALAAYDAENYTQALALVVRAKTMDPSFIMSHNLESQILLAQGDRAGAAEALKRFIDQAPEGVDTTTARRALEALEGPGN